MQKGRTILVLQHADPEDLGTIAQACTIEGADYTYLRPDLGEKIPRTLDHFGGLILMGGPQSVYEEERFPFLKAEKAITRHAVDAERPVLGVCLGSQLLAEVLGSQVRAGASFELGWKDVRVSQDVAGDPVLGHLPRTITPLHWHGDVYDLPPGTMAVGSSDLTLVQGFAYKHRCYGLLFHLEATLPQLRAMALAFPEDLRRGGVSSDALTSEGIMRLDASHNYGLEAFRSWVKLV